uniref:Uncharacterized protein n=1 Tax=Cucumis melo TaxID=3656 RepID=A0A9I9EH65_CUCME
MDFMFLGLQLKRNYKRSSIATLPNPHVYDSLLGLPNLQERRSLCGGNHVNMYLECCFDYPVVVAIENLFCAIHLDICFRNHVDTIPLRKLVQVVQQKQPLTQLEIGNFALSLLKDLILGKELIDGCIDLDIKKASNRNNGMDGEVSIVKHKVEKHMVNPLTDIRAVGILES